MLNRLRQLWREGLISDIDWFFSRYLAGLDASTPDNPASADSLLAACLTSHLTGAGHVCADLGAMAGQVLWRPGQGEPLVAPAIDTWLTGLRDCCWVGAPGDYRPLILNPQGQLYLHRYWLHEQRLAAALRRRMSAVADVDEARLKQGLERLFPRPGPAQAADPGSGQRLAAAMAVLQQWCVIAGGPGTGKTRTVARILALLIEQHPDTPPRIGLAAPTGKAAARLQESIAESSAGLEISDAVRAAMPAEAATLHRLLGVRRDGGFYHHRGRPLPLDVLIVDEASMIDLALMSRLSDALPPDARLILLGDQDQLFSVEAGAVLAELCGSNTGFSPDFARRLQHLTGDLPEVDTHADLDTHYETKTGVDTHSGMDTQRGALADHSLSLSHSFRFGGDSGLAALAGAVNRGDADQALALFAGDKALIWQEPSELENLLPTWVSSFEALVDAVVDSVIDEDAVGRAFAAVKRLVLLCAHHRGPFGTRQMNRRIADLLDRRASRPSAQLRAGRWRVGQPIMITRNDRSTGLYNGDIGILFPHATVAGQLTAVFQSSRSGYLQLPPERLPEHETGWAMTVHKSQGSEYEQVVLLLPGQPSPVVTREWLYTGLTRARSAVTLLGHEAVFRDAVSRRVRRASGLRRALLDA